MKSIRVRWGLLRSMAGLFTFFTFVIIVAMVPPQLGVFRIPALIVAIIVSALVTFRCSLMWARISLISEVSLFFLPMISALFLFGVPGVFPILILAFVMILFSDHMVNMVSDYGRQFSTISGKTFLDFNTPILEHSLRYLSRRLILNGAVFAGCYLVTIVALLGELDFSRLAPILSDASLYILVISISLALLVTMKED